jgi:hypothetical protein
LGSGRDRDGSSPRFKDRARRGEDPDRTAHDPIGGRGRKRRGLDRGTGAELSNPLAAGSQQPPHNPEGSLSSERGSTVAPGATLTLSSAVTSWLRRAKYSLRRAPACSPLIARACECPLVPKCTRLVPAKRLNLAIAGNTICPFAGPFSKPSDGLEPSTPSLPCAPIGNWSQPTATVLACSCRSPGLSVCHRLPLVATAWLHSCSTLMARIADGGRHFARGSLAFLV